MAVKFPLSVEISAVDKFTAPLARMQAGIHHTFGPIESAAHGAAESVGRVVERLAAVAAGVGAVVAATGAALFEFAESTARAGHEAAIAARKVGVEVGTYQELAHAARLAGISQEDLDHNLAKMVRNMGLVALGNRAADAGFRRLGVAVLGADRRIRPVEVVLGEVADRLQQLDDPLKRNAIAALIFGKGAAGLTNLLHLGSKGLRAAAADAHYLGVVLSDQDVEASERFEHALIRVRAALLGIRNAIGTKLLDLLAQLGERLVEFLVAHRPEVEELARKLGERLPAVLEQLYRLLQRSIPWMERFGRVCAAVVDDVGPLGVALGALGAVLTVTVVPAVLSMIASLYTLSAAIVGTPAGWILLVVAAYAAAFALLAYDLLMLANNWDLIWGFIKTVVWGAKIRIAIAVDGMLEPVRALMRGWAKVKQFFSDLWDWVEARFAQALAYLSEKVRAIGAIVPDWLKNALGYEPGIPGARGAPASGGVASGGSPSRAAAAARATVRVEFDNVPRGTKVTQAAAPGVDLDLALGYSLPEFF